MKSTVLYTLCCLLFIFGCKSAKNDFHKTKMTFTKLISDSYGGYHNQQFLIVKNNEALTKIYNQVNLFRKPGFPKPKIDFDKNMVIGLFLGEKKYGGYSISVNSIAKTKNNLIIYYKIDKPNQNGLKTMAINNPFYFCTLKKTDKKVIFKLSE